PESTGLIQIANGRGIAIRDCEVIGAGRNGIVLEGIEGEVTGTTVTGALGAAIHALDSRGLVIARNTIRNASNNGIQVWRSAPGDDGTQVLDNRIEDIAAQSGGSGQNGNAVNVFRAHNVAVRGNRIRNAAFSAVRGNAASNIQITNNTCTGLGEVAIYAEFGFEGAVIANNTIDGAAIAVPAPTFNPAAPPPAPPGNSIPNTL